MRRLRLFAVLVALCLALMSGTPAVGQGACEPGGTAPVFEVDGVALEGITVTKDGTIYASGDATGKIFRRAPDGVVTEVASLWDTAGEGAILGLTADNKRNVYAAVNHFSDPSINGVWRIDASGTAELFAQIPLGGILNGITIDSRKNLYVSESFGGKILRVSPDGVVDLWAEDPLLLDSLGFGFGVNGLDHYKTAIYGSITLDGRIVEVPINADGSAGTPRNYVASELLFGVDQAIFDLHGDLYALNVFLHTIVKVDQDLAVTNFVEADPNVYKPASVSLGRPGDHFSIYITNYEDAFDWFPPPDPVPNPDDVVKVDLCAPGKR